MKEEWLMSGAVVPVDVETTAALVAEIHRLIDVVGGLVLQQGPDYERGFVDGMQKQMQSSVDKAVNRMAQPAQYKCTVIDNQHPNGIPLEQWVKPQQRPWVDLRDSQIETIYYETVKVHRGAPMPQGQVIFGRAVQNKLRELNT
jgi:hypothetical protein